VRPILRVLLGAAVVARRTGLAMSVITNSEFLEALFADLPDDAAAMVCGFAGDPKPPKPNADERKRWFARPWSFGGPLRRCGSASNNYVAVSSFYADPELGEYRRRKANFARLHAVMLDDLGDGPGAKLPMRHADRLPVSALVETSPRNYQAWLFLEPSTDTGSRERAELLIDCMIAQGLAADTDPGMSGVTRYGRLPVGVNGKTRYLDKGRPFSVRLARWSPDHRFTVAEVAHAFGLDLTAPAGRQRTLPTPRPEDAARRDDEFGALLEVLKLAGLYQATLGEGRHAITCPWRNEHTGGDTSGTAVMEPSERNGWRGGFRCHHGHGKELNIGHVFRFVREITRVAA
jgi:hypothetical protein